MTTSVDIQGMQLAQEDFQAALDQMNSVYSAMTEEQDNLSASWSGMAASAFGQALGAWLDDLYQIRQELVVMTESLSTHTGIYSDANEASQQVVAAFQQGLGGLEGLPTEPVLAARREKAVLLPERVAARRVEGRLLPEDVVTAQRDEEPLLPTESQPRFFESEREMPALPAQQGVPAIPDVPRDRIFFKSEEPEQPLLPELPLLPEQPLLPGQPLLPRMQVRNLELPVEPFDQGVPANPPTS